MDRKEQKIRQEEGQFNRDREQNHSTNSIFAKTDQDEKQGMLKLPDELKQIVSGETSYKKKNSFKHKMMEDEKTKKSMKDLMYENTLDPNYEDNINKFNDDFDMSLVLLDSEQDQS